MPTISLGSSDGLILVDKTPLNYANISFGEYHTETIMKANIGLIGLAVMGQNLVLNMNDHGFKVAVYNRTKSTTDEFLAGPAKGTLVVGTHSLEELIDSLENEASRRNVLWSLLC